MLREMQKYNNKNPSPHLHLGFDVLMHCDVWLHCLDVFVLYMLFWNVICFLKYEVC